MKDTDKDVEKARELAEGLANVGKIENEGVDDGFTVIKPIRNKFIEFATAHIYKALKETRKESDALILDLKKEIENLEGGYCNCKFWSDYRLFWEYDQQGLRHGDCGKLLSPEVIKMLKGKKNERR